MIKTLSASTRRPAPHIAGLGLWLAAVALVAACSQVLDEQALLSAARKHLQANDPVAATLVMKTLLQEIPESAEGRLLLGRALLESGDAAGAEAELRRALELDEVEQAVIPPLAMALVAQQKSDQLIKQYGQTEITDDVGAATLKTQLALAYAAGGDQVRAEQALNEALRRAPASASALVLKARLVADRGDAAAAATMTDGLLAKSPGDAEAWVLKGDLLQRSKAPAADAVAAYRKAVGLRPSLMPAQMALMALLIGQPDLDAAEKQLEAMKKVLPKLPPTLFYDALLGYLRKDFARARALSQTLLRGAPDNPRVLLLAGQTELALGSLTQAETLLKKAVLAEPDAAEPRLSLARAQLRSGQAVRALESIQSMIDSSTPSAEALALAGQAQLLRGDFKKADASFARALAIKPGDAGIRTAQAMAMMRQGQADQALRELQATAADNTEDTTADLALISTRISRNELEAALKAVDQLAVKIPDEALPDHLRGGIALLQRDPAAARQAFEQALAKDDRFAASTIRLAEMDLTEKKPEAARRRLEALLQRDPENVQALVALVRLSRRTGGSAEAAADWLKRAVRASPGDLQVQRVTIDHLLSTGNGPAALAAAQAALVAIPDEPDLLDRLGQAQLMTGDANQATATFNTLTTLQPKSPLAALRLADAYRAGKDGDRADLQVRRALALAPDWLPAQQAAVALALRQKKPAEAITLARRMQAQQPAEAIGFQIEGDIEAGQQHWDAAVAVLRQAIAKRNPAEAAAHLHLALLSDNKSADALQFEQGWLKAHPVDVGFRRYLGDAAMLRSDWAGAEAHYREVVELQPDDVGALNNLAYLLAKFNKPGAKPLAERAARLAPRRAEVQDTLALIYVADKQIDQAIEAQRRAVDLAPQAGGFRLTLAKLYVQAGDKNKAGDELAELAKLGKAFSGQSEVSRLRRQLRSGPTGLSSQSREGTRSAWAGSWATARAAAMAGGALALLAVPLALLLAAMRLPKFEVKRSISIDAQAPRIFALLDDLHQWQRWSVMKPFDPALKHSFLRGQTSPGAVYNWKDERKKREGSMEIMHALAPKQLAVESAITKPNDYRQWYEFSLATDPASATATVVTCVSRGEAPFWMRFSGLLRGGLDRRIGNELLANLNRLKATAEATDATQPGPHDLGRPTTSG